MSIVVGLDPNCYLFKDPDDETLDIARFDLCKIAKNLKENEAKVLYHEQMKYVSGITDLFNDKRKDPVMIAFHHACDNVLEILELENTYSGSVYHMWIDGEYIDIMLNGIFEVQSTRYHNRIILSNNPGKKDIKINKIIFKHVGSIDDGSLDINLLCNIDIDTMDEWLYIYEWYFSRNDRKKIILSDYFRKNICSFSNQLEVITSMIRGVYHPDYIYMQRGLTSNKKMIECHPDKHDSELDFYIYNDKGEEISQARSKIYRAHITSLSAIRGIAERIYYITDNFHYIILDCGGHDFNIKKYKGKECNFNHKTTHICGKNETKCYKIGSVQYSVSASDNS